ncbi:MAG: helix-turn-helix domain-containing protein [OCS116 cluster bacterium]|nr:helix-turn-helix domain-containing protein [OCS116 cluster bacterium]
MAHIFLIGQLATQTEVNIETIRYYEKIGLLPKAQRSAGGNRQYSDDDVKRLRFIRRCRQLDFNISEISALLAMLDNQQLTCNEIYDFTQNHLKSIAVKISSLKKMQKNLTTMAKKCNRGQSPDCAIIDILFD